MRKQYLLPLMALFLSVQVSFAQDTVQVAISDIDIEQGQSSYDVAITASNFKKLVSISYTLEWNAADFQFVDIMHTHQSLDMEFNMDLVNEGRLPVLWFDAFLNGKTLAEGDTLMTVRFELLSDACSGESFHFTDDPTRITFLDIDNSMPFTIKRGEVRIPVCLTSDVALLEKDSYSIFPNPSFGQVRIKAKQRVDLIELFDVTGLRLATFQGTDTFYFGGTGLFIVRLHTRKGVGQQRLFLR